MNKESLSVTKLMLSMHPHLHLNIHQKDKVNIMEQKKTKESDWCNDSESICNKHDDHLKALSTPIKRKIFSSSFRKDYPLSSMVELDVETIRPIIDLAYWSTNIQVKRDVAATFSTLSNNHANLHVLSQAGTLGALLNLLNYKHDLHIVLHASKALCDMVTYPDTQKKMVSAPNGLTTLFYLIKNFSNNSAIKRNGAQALAYLVENEKIRPIFIQSNTISIVIPLLRSKEIKIQKLAAHIMKTLAQSSSSFFSTQQFDLLLPDKSIQEIIKIFQNYFQKQDTIFQKDLCTYLLLLCQYPLICQRLASSSFVICFIGFLDLQVNHKDIVILSLKVLGLFASHPENHFHLEEQGLLINLKNIFLFLSTSSSSHLNNSPVKSPSKKPCSSDQFSDKNSSFHSSNQLMIRLTMNILLELAKGCNHGTLGDDLLNIGLFDHVINESYNISNDIKLKKSVGKIIFYLSCTHGKSSDRHINMMASGVLRAILNILNDEVEKEEEKEELHMDAIHSLANFTDTKSLRISLCKDLLLLQRLIKFSVHPLNDIRENVAKILADFAQRKENQKILYQHHIHLVLKKIIALNCYDSLTSLHATRAFAYLSKDNIFKCQLVDSGVLTFLLQIKKHKRNEVDEEMEYLNQTIHNLKYDAAALKIQNTFKSWYHRIKHQQLKINTMKSINKIKHHASRRREYNISNKTIMNHYKCSKYRQ